MSIQVNADWTRRGTAAQLEHEFSGFKFKGPGLYLTKTWTLLVVPHIPGNNLWKQKWPEDTLFMAYYYSASFKDTIFGQTFVPPIRTDER